MNDDLLKEFKRQLHRAKVKAWFAEHPDYQRQYAAKQKQLRSELGVSTNGTIRVPRIKGKVTYTINVRRPLKPEERYSSISPQQPQRLHRVLEDSSNRPQRSGTQDEDTVMDFVPGDLW